MPYIGSLSQSLKDLNIRDEELWTIFEEKIGDDQWYTNFKESVAACEGMTYL
jgi:hypothetical protein